MTMPIRAAQNLVEGAIQNLAKVSPNTAEGQIMSSSMILDAVREVQNRLERLRAGGYRMDRIQSTLILCNEVLRQQQTIQKMQDDQKARMLQLAAGLNEIR
jgi:hypothetical protein